MNKVTESQNVEISWLAAMWPFRISPLPRSPCGRGLGSIRSRQRSGKAGRQASTLSESFLGSVPAPAKKSLSLVPYCPDMTCASVHPVLPAPCIPSAQQQLQRESRSRSHGLSTTALQVVAHPVTAWNHSVTAWHQSVTAWPATGPFNGRTPQSVPAWAHTVPAWIRSTTPLEHSLTAWAPQAHRTGASVRAAETALQNPLATDSLFSPKVADAVESLRDSFADVDLLVASNLRRVLTAFRNARVGRHHFSGTTGYGHNDAGGREALDAAFAEIVGAEAALVRSQFFSGTHAIAAALFAVLRPGDELLAVAGAPYDTLEEVIGTRGTPGHGSLKELGVTYRELPLAPDGDLDWAALRSSVGPSTRCAFLQRSCGYSLRRTLSTADIQKAVDIIKAQSSQCIVVVDNCYGEFMEPREPTAVGADLIAGSLIKNPGGGIAPCGGYVAGSQVLVEAVGARLAAPGIGTCSGSTTADVMRLMFQGLFLAPQIVGEAIKGSLLIAEVMSQEGYQCHPAPRAPRRDIIQAVELGSRAKLLAFCEAVQLLCPVGAYIKPTAGATAGYESQVVFADGTFIDGSTIELSCDGPLREPFAVFCQGGTHWTHWAIVLDSVLDRLASLE